MTATPMHSDSSGTWMTKAELARARGITLGSADRLIRKQRWRRQPGNDGKVRALIPPGWENPDPRGEPTDDPTDDPRAVGMSSLAAGALTALEDAVSALREQLERAEAGRVEERQRADRAEARADDLRAQIDVLNAELVVMRAEADRQLAEERQRADRFSEQVEAGHREVDAARAEAETLRTDLAVARQDAQAVQEWAAELRQAEAARKARGRLRRAWDGWRGR